MGTGTEADGGDEPQKEVALGRFLADVLLEGGDDDRREHQFHEDEEPPGTEEFGRGQRSPGLDDDAGQRRLFAEAEQVVADGRRNAVQRVAEHRQQADRAARLDCAGAEAGEQNPDHGDRQEGSEQDAERDSDLDFDTAVDGVQVAGRRRRKEDENARNRHKTGRRGRPPALRGTVCHEHQHDSREDAGGEVDGGRTEKRPYARRYGLGLINRIERAAAGHPRRERGYRLLGDGRSAPIQQGHRRRAGDEQSEQVRERWQREIGRE